MPLGLEKVENPCHKELKMFVCSVAVRASHAGTHPHVLCRQTAGVNYSSWGREGEDGCSSYQQ